MSDLSKVTQCTSSKAIFETWCACFFYILFCSPYTLHVILGTIFLHRANTGIERHNDPSYKCNISINSAQYLSYLVRSLMILPFNRRLPLGGHL